MHFYRQYIVEESARMSETDLIMKTIYE